MSDFIAVNVLPQAVVQRAMDILTDQITTGRGLDYAVICQSIWYLGEQSPFVYITLVMSRVVIETAYSEGAGRKHGS